MSTFTRLLEELQFGGLEKNVKVHLQKVYTAMGLALLAAAAGAYLHVAGLLVAGSGLLMMLISIGMIIGIHALAPTPENQATRFTMLMALAGSMGIAQGPLIKQAVEIDPSLVMTAFLATALVFLCFSASALLSEDRKWLALGGILSSAISWLLFFGLMNIFFKSQIIYQATLYIGLAVFCAYILYDTQIIVEKRRRGDDDYIVHCMTLFIDFIGIFVRILIILTDKERSKKRRRD